MSQKLVQSLGNTSAGCIVDKLDAKSPTGDEQHLIGPFGVFDATETLDKEHTSSELPGLRKGRILGLENRQIQEQFSAALPVQPQDHSWINRDDDTSSDKEFDSFFSQLSPMMSSNMANCDWIGCFDGDNCVGADNDQRELADYSQPTDSFDDESLFLMMLASESDASVQPLNVHESPSSTQDGMRETPPRTAIHISLPARISSHRKCALPEHAEFLLHYLRVEVLTPSNATTFAASRVSPWNLLLLPCALQTFAEMSILDSTSHIRRSLLSTLLAKSAFHLHERTTKVAKTGVICSPLWDTVAVRHQTNAQKCLDTALREATTSEHQAEYGEMLMAILGVLFGQMFCHRRQWVERAAAVTSTRDAREGDENAPLSTKELLLEAERLIRLRGLRSTKSFNLRVLHHMYTHLRVIAESTDVLPLDAGDSSTQSAAFRVQTDDLGRLDNLQEKPDEVGYNDIHLDVSGNWRLTMYLDIYGVPESLMTLLSQTISLANEKPRLERIATSNSSVATALAQHVQTLEHQLWTWSPRLPTTTTANRLQLSAPASLDKPSPKSLQDDAELHPLVGAMHQTLIIYFYRRIYHMSAMIIQEQVRKTLEFLDACPEMENVDQDFAMTFGWILFVCLCEAATAELQCRAMKYMDPMDQHGVFVTSIGRPSSVVKSIWNKRQESGNQVLSWADVGFQEAF